MPAKEKTLSDAERAKSECVPLRARLGLTMIRPHSIVHSIGWLGPRKRRRRKAANTRRNN